MLYGEIEGIESGIPEEPESKEIRMIIDGTPVERYSGISCPEVWVKREDLSCPPPGPPFSKMRGIKPYLEKLKRSGITRVGYVETSVSMAGWGVAWIGNQIGMDVIIFDPQQKNVPSTLKIHREKWKEFGATIIPVPPGRSKINWYRARNFLDKNYPKNETVLLPLGLPLEETLIATAQEFLSTENISSFSSIVCAIGSGTIFSGIIRGVKAVRSLVDNAFSPLLVGVLTRNGISLDKKMEVIRGKSRYHPMVDDPISMVIIQSNYSYSKPASLCERKQLPSFPCNPYYDLKAWEYIVDRWPDHQYWCDKKILFWNIGA